MLVIGDCHVPFRSVGLPSQFKQLLVPGKIQHVLCTGSICTKEMLDYLRSIAGDVHVVRGEFDEVGMHREFTTILKVKLYPDFNKFPKSVVQQPNLNFPEEKVVTVGQFRIALIHGHQIVPWGDQESLAMLQRQLDVDVVISGHTHKFQANIFHGKYFINPGSATGAYTPLMM